MKISGRQGKGILHLVGLSIHIQSI